MTVNLVADNFGVQQAAASLNQLAAAELRQIDDQQKTEEKKTDERSNTEKMADGESSKKMGKQVLSDLISKLGGSGIKLNSETFIGKAGRNARDEYDMLLKTRDESADQVDLQSLTQKIGGNKKLNNKMNGQNQNGQGALDAQEMAGTLQEFSNAFVEFQVNGGAELKKKMERLEQKLLKDGFKASDLLSLKQNIMNSLRAQIASHIKENLLKKAFSKEKSLEWVMNDKSAHEVIGFAFNSHKLGGYDFGGYKGNLQGTTDESLREINSELRDFVRDELKTAHVRKHLGDNSADQDIKKLIEMGMKSGVDFKQFLSQWQSNMNHIGIVPVPPEAMQQSALGSGTQDRRERTGYEFNQDDEKEILINQLRSVYMLRAVRNDLRTQIDTSFKIRKLKNGLIKLGVTFADFEKLEQEGGVLGRVKLLDMLKETLFERATIYTLSGPAFSLIEKKIKGLMKNLERLGMELSKTEFDSMRDTANYAMFDIARNELENTIILYESRQFTGLERKIKLTIRLMKRLQEESNIVTDYDPDLRFAAVQEAA